MKRHFNLARYKELLELQEIEKFGLLDEKGLELLYYRADVEDQFCYNRKKDYFLLIQKYLNDGASTTGEFASKFLEMEWEHTAKANILLQDFQELEVFTFSDSEDVDKFTDPIIGISDLCSQYGDMYDETPALYGKEFYDVVNDYFLQLKKAFPLDI